MGKIFEQKSSTGSSWLIVLPKKLFKAHGYELGDNVEFTVKNGDIIIKKVESETE